MLGSNGKGKAKEERKGRMAEITETAGKEREGRMAKIRDSR